MKLIKNITRAIPLRAINNLRKKKYLRQILENPKESIFHVRLLFLAIPTHNSFVKRQNLHLSAFRGDYAYLPTYTNIDTYHAFINFSFIPTYFSSGGANEYLIANRHKAYVIT